jgi:hypothetical protein
MAWLTMPPPHDAQPEHELPHEPLLQSPLQPQLGAQAVAQTGRMVTCWAQDVQGEYELHDEQGEYVGHVEHAGA